LRGGFVASTLSGTDQFLSDKGRIERYTSVSADGI
jgi:hypothetical protein